MRRDDTSWRLTNQALGLREVVGAGERVLVLSLLAFPSRSMAAPARTEGCSVVWEIKHADTPRYCGFFLCAINKPLELRKSNPDV